MDRSFPSPGDRDRWLVIKLINTAKAKFESKQDEAPARPPEDVVLLREIRDALARR